MLLNVGTVIYSSDGAFKSTISRVTAKRAYCKVHNYELSFVRDIGSRDSFKPIGSHGWDSTDYSVETSELINKHHRCYLLYKFEKIIPQNLSVSQLEQIIKVTDSKEAPLCQVDIPAVVK
jgi:hypothetical protein